MTTRLTASGIVYGGDGSSDTTYALNASVNLGTYDIGTYMLAWKDMSTSGHSMNDTVLGSSLRASSVMTITVGNVGYGVTSLPGSWRCMGQVGYVNGGNYAGNDDCRITLWLRYA